MGLLLLQSEIAQAIELTAIINRSTSTKEQQEFTNAQTQLDWLQMAPIISPWQNSFESNFERLSSKEEGQNFYREFDAFRVTSVFQQSTPYGLSLGVNYERLLDLPSNFSGFQPEESLQANIYISLLNDFLGHSTRNAQGYWSAKARKIFMDQTQGQVCQNISNAFFDAFLAQVKLNIQVKSLEQIKTIFSRLQLGARKGTLRRQDELSLLIDRTQLINQIAELKSQQDQNLLKLSLESKIPIQDLQNLTLDQTIAVEKITAQESMQILDQLDQEIGILNSKKDLVRLNQRNDISLYGGIRQNIAANPAFSDFNSSALGINVKWNFSNQAIENSISQIEMQVIQKEVQKSMILAQQSIVNQNYQFNLKQKLEVVEGLRTNLKYAKELSQLSQNNLASGRLNFFDFLNIRNQTNQSEIQYAENMVTLYQQIINYAKYRGDYSLMCLDWKNN